MRKSLQIFFLSSAFFLLSSAFCFSQTYWNEWINFNGQQKYFKMLVDSNGIYRLDSLTLSNAGINLSTIDSRSFQIFFRGQEQYIYVADNNGNNVLNNNDYIEFYGQKNDGSLDSVLYKGNLYNQPVRQPNPYYSLFNDTSAFFLTWNTSTNNKRIIDSLDVNYSAYPTPSSYFMKQDIIDNHSSYYAGLFSVDNISFPGYDESEGWSGGYFSSGSSYAATFNTANLYQTNENVEIKFAVMGESDDIYNNPDHIIDVKYRTGISSYSPIDNASFDGYHLLDSAIYRSANTFNSNSTDVVFSASGNFSASRVTVPYVTMKYPHNTSLENKTYFEMYVPQDLSQPQSYYTFSNNTMSSAFLYDLTDHYRIPITNSKVLVPNSLSGGEKFCVVKAEQQFLQVVSIKSVEGTGFFTNYSSMAADSAFIIITNKSLMGDALNGAIAYKNYRSGALGGSHKVIIADIDDLYDQFGYGIPKFPFAIRHFVDYCFQNFPAAAPPKNLFLIGKSIEPDKIRNRTIDPQGKNYAISFVPSIGFPTTDNMLVAGLRNTILESPLSIGRLSAKNTAEVTNYLSKINEFEHPIPNPDEWMKNAIFISGGADASQMGQFCSYVKYYATIMQDTSFGGYGHIFCKNSSSPTQTSYTDSLIGLINSGVSLITYFGHSAGNVFEFNIPLPSQCSNTNGKYPLFVAGGCLAGDIHQSPYAGDLSSSEVYTLASTGTIAFFASSGLGTVGEDNQLLTDFHLDLSTLQYGKPIGKIIQSAFKNAETTFGSGDNYMNAAILEMTLEGDPSIILHESKLPDYAITNSSVYFSPTYVSTDQSTFNVNVIITNIGKATNDSVKTTVVRHFSNGTTTSYTKTLPKIYYKDTVTFTMPVDPINGPGLNTFEVHVNPNHTPSENNNDYANNDISSANPVQLMIYSGDIIPVYPYEYAIIPSDTVTLKANTANPFASSVRYVFQIDTTEQFNSPLFLKTQKVIQSGSVVKAPFNLWSSPPLILKDSVVYYWRVRRDTNDFVNFHWRESSFQYIPHQRGWGQSHFFQFLKGDKFQSIDTNRASRAFYFDKQNHTLTVSTLNYTKQGRTNAAEGYIYFAEDVIKVSNSSFTSAWAAIGNYPTPSHVLVSVLDPVSGNLWENTGNGPYGSVIFGAQPVPVPRFEFLTSTAAGQDSLQHFLQNVVPCGSKVVLYTCDNNNLGDLLGGNSPHTNPGLVQAFQSIGGTQFPNMRNNLPYIIIGRKCGNAIEKIGMSDTSIILLADTFGVSRSSGIIFSETVGPASKWGSFHWKYSSLNPANIPYDTMTVNVVGIRSNSTTDTLMRNITKTSFDIYNLSSIINADSFPNLQLLGYAKDATKKIPPQLKKWQVYYDGVPEASLNKVKHCFFYNPTLQQGDSVKFSVAIENIGDYNMDSLWFDAWILDANRVQKQLQHTKLKPLLVDSVLIANAKFETSDLTPGQNSVWLEANPYSPTSHHQPEEYHFNNIGTVPFTLSGDKINPLLDVTFDGVHIMNGDIVSAKPNILIKVKDENTFLAVDTSSFQIFLKRPSQSVFERLYPTSLNNMTFTPAVMPNNNSCKINYTPALSDGTYQLKVQSKDKSGNFSGSNEYYISFEVINKPTITHVLNYPNPFSTSTRFVFTLTGSVVPDYFKIQIITITGKMVKEVDKFEMGPLHIGTNITEYAWDGKDMFGDQLANGLYLYRVITQLNGQSLEQRQSGADPFFVHDYGKMYLIR